MYVNRDESDDKFNIRLARGWKINLQSMLAKIDKYHIDTSTLDPTAGMTSLMQCNKGTDVGCC